MAKLMNRFGTWLLSNHVNAGICCLVAALLAPLLSFFTITISILFVAIVIGFVTCARGIASGLALLAWLLIPIIAQFILRQYDMQLEVEFSVLYGAMLAWIIAVIFRWQRDWMNTLWIVTAFCALISLGLNVYLPHMQQFWLHLLTVEFDTLSKMAVLPEASIAAEQAKIVTYAPWMTGLVIANIAVLFAFTVYIGQIWQARVQNKDLHLSQNMRLSKTVWLLVVFMLAAIYSNRAVLEDFGLIICIPAIFAGYTIWRSSAKRNGLGFVSTTLIASYIVLLKYPTAVLVLWALTALLDTSFNVRDFLTKKEAIKNN
jgi:hypothetical protein